MAKVSKEDFERALSVLRDALKPGDTVYTVIRHVSRSGMSRSISPIVHTPTGPEDMSWAVARVLGASFDRRNGGVKVGGCGMDMGFHLVHNLGYALWPKGFGCVGEGCPSNDHSNGDRDYTPHGNSMTPYAREVLIGRDHWHREPGYALRQRWL